MPFTASTLQIGGYHSYQHRKLQAAQVTITEPDSAVSAIEASLLPYTRVADEASNLPICETDTKFFNCFARLFILFYFHVSPKVKGALKPNFLSLTINREKILLQIRLGSIS